MPYMVTKNASIDSSGQRKMNMKVINKFNIENIRSFEQFYHKLLRYIWYTKTNIYTCTCNILYLIKAQYKDIDKYNAYSYQNDQEQGMIKFLKCI